MIDEKIKKIINETIIEIINNSSNKINTLNKKHNNKIHFIPKKYRILGGLLQSMNIQFGNFLEILIRKLIIHEGKYEIIENLSKSKNNIFIISLENETIIDKYITECQKEQKDLISEFHNL